jgi:murein DD-endopeptidase MepM/ murein hydrolase activator NlpD
MTLKKLVTISICLLLMPLTIKAQNNKTIAHNKTTVNAEIIKLKKMNASAFNELYDDWNNISCHAKVEYIPNTYKIDLRDFSMPIEHNVITSNFGYRAKFKRNHYGVDIKANLGDTIYSTFGGKVRVVKNEPRGYGNVVVIRHWNGLETVYGHLSKQIVKVNDVVTSGQPIGLAGNTGRSFGTHLHFETRFCGIAINPLEIFSFKYKDVTNDFYSWKKKQ